VPYLAPYLLSVTPSIASSASVAPVFPDNGGGAACNAVSYSGSHFLDLLDRIFPSEYLSPLKAYSDSGYEMYQQASEIFARASLATERFECGNVIIFATGGAFATGEVEFYRPTAAAGAVDILAGTIVSDNSGREFAVLQDVVFGALDVGPITAYVQAAARGYEWNLPGQSVTLSAITLPGAIDTIKMLLTSPVFADISFEVRQILATSGGVSPDLDGLGADRGIYREPGEPDPAYRLRIRTLADTVSPGAMLRLVASILNPLNVPWNFVETWDIAYQTCYDAPSPNVGTPSYLLPPYANIRYDSNLFAYDDPRPSYPVRGVYLDELESRGAFIVNIQGTPLMDCGMAYDDPGVYPYDFRDPATGRQRGTSAYDLTSSMSAASVYPAVYDGYDVQFRALLTSLFQQLQKIKAGGVAALVEVGYP